MKNKYREFCEIEKSIPVFSRAWWLDAVCGKDNWDVCIIEQGREVVASMPYYKVKKLGLTFLIQPPLTQTLGPWIRPPKGKYSKVLGKQKELMQKLIEQLPPFHYFKQSWHYNNTNWLPFYWSGFQQTTRYTYVIPDISDFNKVYGDFESSKKKNIKKCMDKIKIVHDIPFDDFYENHKMTLAKQGQTITYSKELFKRLYEGGYKENSAKTIAAYDENDNLHAALFVVWDENSAYDLISTIDPAYRTQGAASLLVQEVIKELACKVNKFDFEGSMIEGVERSFRQFGAIQTQYHSVSKSNSKLWDAAQMLKSWIK